MLTFLRKIRKSLIDSGSVRKYLLYAIGEIALVVIGILIALQINNWNQIKQEKQQEEILLTEMAKNLKQDLANFETQLNLLQLRNERVSKLSKLLEDETAQITDSLFFYCGAVYGLETARINPAIYEDLKSRGFELIKDDSLRLNINQFFEEAIYQVNAFAILEQSINQVIRSYYLTNFKNIQFRTRAEPIEAKFILKDFHFKNLVDYRLITLEVNQLKFYPWFIAEMDDLINHIQNYIKRDQ